MNLVSQKMQEVRLHKGFNKSQMAKEIGISSQLYGKYEEGEISPKVDFFKKFEKKFDINLLHDEKISLTKCSKCSDKERTIEAQKITIEALQANIKMLQKMMEMQKSYQE